MPAKGLGQLGASAGSPIWRADGLTNREIAQALFVTQKTIEIHLRNAYRKLDINVRARGKRSRPAQLEPTRSATRRVRSPAVLLGGGHRRRTRAPRSSPTRSGSRDRAHTELLALGRAEVDEGVGMLEPCGRGFEHFDRRLEKREPLSAAEDDAFRPDGEPERPAGAERAR